MKKFSWIFFLLIGFFLFGQTQFITINGDITSLEEFEKSQQQNLKMLGVDKSIELFTDFELLTQFALSEGADNDQKFIKNYYLALDEFRENEKVPSQKIDAAIDKMYQKIKTEYKVQILYADAKHKEEIQSKIEKGNDFTQLISQYSLSQEFIEPSYLKYQQLGDEELKMIQNIKVSKVSQPISFGGDKWMWIKKINERPNAGLYRFQRIGHKDKNVLENLRQRAIDGEDFTKLVEEYSQIPKDGKGVLKDAMAGIPDEVYAAAKGVKVGDYTPVFEYNGMYQLYRVLRHVPMQNKKEKRAILFPIFELSDEYYALYDENLKKIDTVKSFKVYPKNREELKANGSIWFQDTITTREKKLFEIGGVEVQQSDILNNMREAGAETVDSQLIDLTIEESLYNLKAMYYENVLFYQEERTRSVVDSIKKANLISYAFDELILNKSYSDEKGMKDYIAKNKERFTFPERAQMRNYYCVNQSVATELEKMMKKRKSDEEIKAAFQGKVDANNRPFIYLEQGKVSQNSEEYPNGVPFKKGIYTTHLEDGRYLVSQVQKILPPQLMTLEEAKLGLMEEYQNEYYKKTIHDLKENATIEINPEALQKLKNKYKN